MSICHMSSYYDRLLSLDQRLVTRVLQPDAPSDDRTQEFIKFSFLDVKYYLNEKNWYSPVQP